MDKPTENELGRIIMQDRGKMVKYSSGKYYFIKDRRQK